MYTVIGIEPFTNTETKRSGLAYFCARKIKDGLKPEFTFYSYEALDVEVNDEVYAEISTGRDGKIFVRNIVRIGKEVTL